MARIAAKLWKVLNSAFVLWFLSTVCLGTLGYLHANWREERSAEIADQKKARLLDLEISDRLVFFDLLFGFTHILNDPAQPAGVDSPASAKINEGLRLTLLELGPPDGMHLRRNMFPEFRERDVVSLLIELHELIPPGEKQEVIRCAAVMRQIQKTSLSLTPPFTRPGHQLYDIEILETDNIVRGCNLARWGKPLINFDRIFKSQSWRAREGSKE